jgi:4-hydroxy-tetrahydrodipicolinate synthase
VIGQGVGGPFCDMFRFGLEGAFAKAYPLHFELMPIIDLIFEEGNPVGIKSVLASKGIGKDVVRLPLVKVSPHLSQKIRAYLAAN